MADALLQVLQDRKGWKGMAANGIEGVRKHYSWQAHVEKYIGVLRPLTERATPSARMPLQRRRMLYRDQAIVTDLDQNLLGDPESLEKLVQVIHDNRKQTVFVIATGRRFDSAMRILRHHHIPQPDILISSLGTEIHYAPNLDRDTAWADHIDYLWKPRSVRRILSELPGLKIQPSREQSQFKISYYYDAADAPPLEDINSLLHQHELSVNVFLAFGQFLDIVPVRASKGYALRWFAEQWNIPLEHVLAAGGSGSDEDTMRGNTLAVVVANRHHEELSALTDVEQVYFSEQPFAAGILEAIEHYQFFNIGQA
jgi:sucrose-phosphate synthase